jgi:predicted O-linked N-acetylglucosamine transferase (SPINDLY family)
MTKNLGASLMRRVVWVGKLPYEKYQRLFSLATAVLDSPVFTGGYTAYDAFSCGVPMVTMPGTVGVQTFTSGFYRKMNMPEMVTHSPEQYVEMAVRLGTDQDFRATVSKRILERCDVLYNEALAVHEFARFFEKAIQKERER